MHGFARTLARIAELAPPADRYLEMIEAASAQMAELLDELSLAARIESGRYEPTLREADTLELAQRRGGAARRGPRARLRRGRASCRRTSTRVDRGVSALVQAALRHGGLDEVDVVVRGAEIDVSPITDSSAPVVLGRELRDLGAAVAVRLVERLGGTVAVEGGVADDQCC